MKKVGFLVLGLAVLVTSGEANAQFIRRPIVVTPVVPVYPVQPVYPVRPVFPVRPILPVRPVVPVVPVVPVYPVYPVPVYPIFPVYPVNPFPTPYPYAYGAVAPQSAPNFRFAGQSELTTGVNHVQLSGDHADRIQVRLPAGCGIEIQGIRALEGRSALTLGSAGTTTVNGTSIATYTVSRNGSTPRVDRLEITVGKVQGGSCSVEVRTAAH